MPIPKWCDKKSIRTIKRGGARILICCPKGKTRAGKCSVGTRAIDVKLIKLAKGTRTQKYSKTKGRITTFEGIDGDAAAPFVAVSVDSRGREHGRWVAKTITAAMAAADAEASPHTEVTVRGDRTSDGRVWGPGRGRVEAVREGNRWRRY